MAALGATAAFAVVVVLLAALVATSPFGIFFTGGNMGDENPTLRECVAKLDRDHAARIEAIKADTPHNSIMLEGSKAPWKEVLAIFAVKTTTNASNPLDAITLDEERQRLLENVYWDMNRIESRIEMREVDEIVLEEDEKGDPTETVKTVSERVLYIDLSSASADETASTYGFVSAQINLLRQLLDEKNNPLWQTMLYGTSQGNADIVEIARTQLGNVGGQPYWSWYGFPSRVEWCACFVSWCANECGLIENGSVPKFAYCPSGIQWFKDAGRWRERGYEPQPGDIIFFDWGGDGVSDHVGIVESCDGATVFTIEGNSGDACQRNSYDIGSASIMGYGGISNHFIAKNL